MDSIKTRGLIARRTDFGEANCILTIISEDLGVVSACAYGVRSKRSKIKASTQVFCFADFILSKKSGDMYRVEQVDLLESFYPICEDIVKLALAVYMCDAALEAYADGDRRILRLVLNIFYALAYKDIEPDLCKAVFELKILEYSGYEPNMDCCSVCGSKETLLALKLPGGAVCALCKQQGCIELSPDVYDAMRYIFNAEEKKVLSFSLPRESFDQLYKIAETYFLYTSERKYKSLEYYKKIK